MVLLASRLTAAAQFSPVKQTHAADDKTPFSFFPATLVWTLPLNSALTAPPAYDESRGFFPIEGDLLAAYTLADGKQAWIAPIRTSVEPATGDGMVFVVAPDALIALNALDGSIAWLLPFADTVAVAPVWDNGWLVAATADGTILAYRATDGELIWRQNVGAPAHARPALAADRVYVPTTDSRVVALRVDTGAPLWEHRLAGPPNDILALDDRLYFGSKDNYFYCLNAKDGEQAWRWRTGADVIGKPLVFERTVYFVSFDNVLRALNRSSGVQRWKAPLSLRPFSGPVQAIETVIVAGVAPTIRGYHARDGKPAGELSTPGDLSSTPHVFSPAGQWLPTLIVVTRDIAKGATVVAFRRSFEPEIAPVGPLPNPVSPTPTPAPTTDVASGL